MKNKNIKIKQITPDLICASKTRWGWVAAGVCIATILYAYIPIQAQSNALGAESVTDRASLTENQNVAGRELGAGAGNPCTEIAEGRWDCSTPEDRAKWTDYIEAKIKDLEGKTFMAIQTKYSRADSCHNPRGNECLTAIGRDTKEGVTVACPSFLKLGTRIYIEGLGERVCEDRYAKRLDSQRGLPTVDVFAEAENLNALHGYKKVKVTIL